jgi:hypothetical protein
MSDILTIELGKMARFIFRACRMGSGGKAPWARFAGAEAGVGGWSGDARGVAG